MDVKVDIEHPGPRIGDAEIDRLERRLGLSLPASYRRFLLTCNGGRPVPDTVDVPGHPKSPTDVQRFFGIDTTISSSGIEWNCEVLRERIGGRYVPIAGDSSGNVFCLVRDDPSDEGIYYLDLQSVFADYEASPTAYSVTASFDDFLQRLRVSP